MKEQTIQSLHTGPQLAPQRAVAPLTSMTPRPCSAQKIHCICCGTLVAIAPPMATVHWLDRHEQVDTGSGGVGAWCPNLKCRVKVEIRAGSEPEDAA